jgi:ABC-type amino acid transport substrate-binding protein
MTIRLLPLVATLLAMEVLPSLFAEEASSQYSKPAIEVTKPTAGVAVFPDSSKIKNPEKIMLVGVAERPPYSTKNDLGVWTGIGVELWEESAKDLGIHYQYKECLQGQLHDQLKAGEIDIILANAQSADFLGVEEFTQPYVYSHGAVVIRHLSPYNYTQGVLHHLSQSGIFYIFLSMFGTMFLISLCLVLFDGAREGTHFIGTPQRRFANALWFTAVTMTSVGYGDSTRLSPIGRTITFIWMMIGILFVALFTGAMVSAINSAEANTYLSGLQDLTHYRCGVFVGAKLERTLQANGIATKGYQNLEEGFEALYRGQITAFVCDSTSATYLMQKVYPNEFKMCLLPDIPLAYSFALRVNDKQFQRINDEVMKFALSPEWRIREARWGIPLSF